MNTGGRALTGTLVSGPATIAIIAFLMHAQTEYAFTSYRRAITEASKAPFFCKQHNLALIGGDICKQQLQHCILKVFKLFACANLILIFEFKD